MHVISESPAQAALKEHEILEHIKQALRVTVGWRTTPEGTHRKLSSVRFTLRSFMRHMERMMELEEQDGYLCFIEDRRPSLHDRIASLAHNHEEFRQVFHFLVPRVESLSDDNNTQLDEVCREISDLLTQVDYHDRREIELLQESMLTDVGGEG